MKRKSHLLNSDILEFLSKGVDFESNRGCGVENPGSGPRTHQNRGKTPSRPPRLTMASTNASLRPRLRGMLGEDRGSEGSSS